VLIPERYVADLGVRLGLYRRIAALADRREIDGFAAELIDRFGPLPPEVENLLEIIAIKRACREAGVERVEAGPKGAVIALRGNRFANPAGLVELIQRHAGTLKLRPDQDRLSAQLGRREDPPRRRRQAASGSGQDRPRPETGRRCHIAAADPVARQAQHRKTSLIR
jgi:transcription-repair coupling factor (superfamily II helicase)